MKITVIILFLVIVIGSFILGLKLKNTDIMNKINKSFKEPNSKGTKILVLISCCLVILTIFIIIMVNRSSNDFVGKLYKLTDKSNFSTMYFKSENIVRIEYINENDFLGDSLELEYIFDDDKLTVYFENGDKMTYSYDSSNDCFIYSSKVKYCY